MSPEETTRAGSRRKLIVESKQDIDYDMLHSERLASDTASRQLEGWNRDQDVHGLYPYDATCPWREYPYATKLSEEARRLLWFAGLAMVATAGIIAILIYLSA